MKRSVLFAAFAAVLCGMSVAVPPIRLKKMFISFWVDPVVAPERFLQEYQRIKDANFTAILGGFGATTEEQVAEQVAAASQVEIDVMPTAYGSAAKVNMLSNSTSPYLLGYQVIDEPSAAEFKDVASWAAAIAAARPGKLAFINLLPNYASTSQLAAADYGTYVREYVAAVQPALLCMDHYPHFALNFTVAGMNNTRRGYHDNLNVFREVSLEFGIPFVNFFNTMPFANYYDLTAAQLRWQAFTSLAYGAKGFLYFCYWTPAGFPLGGAIMVPRGNSSNYVPSEHWMQARDINSIVLAWQPYLLDAVSTGVWLVEGGKLPAESAVAEVNGCHNTVGMLLIGQFVLNNETTVVLIHNQDVNFPVFVTTTFREDIALNTVQEVTMAGTLAALEDDAPLTQGLQIRLGAGDARLFVVMN